MGEYLEKRLELRRKLEEMGFALDESALQDTRFSWERERLEHGWSKLQFIMAAKENVPEIRLTISQHQKEGTILLFYSVPWEELYSSYISKPVSEANALASIEDYLTQRSLPQRNI